MKDQKTRKSLDQLQVIALPTEEQEKTLGGASFYDMYNYSMQSYMQAVKTMESSYMICCGNGNGAW